MAPMIRRVLLGAMWAVFLGVATGYRFSQALAVQPLRYYDTTSYVVAAHRPLGSLAFWAGGRPPLLPLILKVTGATGSLIVLQVLVASLAWGALAWAAGRLVGGWKALVVIAVVLGLSLSAPVIEWDRSLLTESLALSLIVFLLALVLLFVGSRRYRGVIITAFVVSALLLGALRDAQVVVVGLLGLGLVAAGALVVAHRRSLFIGALILVVGSGALAVGALSSHRNTKNVLDVLEGRIFPYSTRVAWFAAHGMPQAKVVERMPVLRLGPRSPVVLINPQQPSFAPLARWIAHEGAPTYALWLSTHPGSIIIDPLRRPQLAFGALALGQYAAPKFFAERSTFDLIVFPPFVFLGPVALAGALLLFWRVRALRSVVLLLSGWGLIGAISMLVDWLGDGQEVGRHSLPGDIMLRQSAVILLALGVCVCLRRLWRFDEFMIGTSSGRGSVAPVLIPPSKHGSLDASA